MQGSVAGLEARNAQLVREVDELKSRLATAGSPNPTMRGSSSNERTKTTATRERDDTKTGVSLGGATRRSAPDARIDADQRSEPGLDAVPARKEGLSSWASLTPPPPPPPGS